jgi:Tat protein translocase TatB subunit
MFDLGMQELIVIFVVALIVFGPKRLPELGRSIGKGLNELKRSMSGIKDQIDDEMKGVKEQVDEGIKDLKVDTLIDQSQFDFMNEDKGKELGNEDEKKEDGGKEVDG